MVSKTSQVDKVVQNTTEQQGTPGGANAVVVGDGSTSRHACNVATYYGMQARVLARSHVPVSLFVCNYRCADCEMASRDLACETGPQDMRDALPLCLAPSPQQARPASMSSASCVLHAVHAENQIQSTTQLAIGCGAPCTHACMHAPAPCKQDVTGPSTIAKLLQTPTSPPPMRLAHVCFEPVKPSPARELW